MTILLTAQEYVFCQNPIKFCWSLHFKKRLPKYYPANAENIPGTVISSVAEKGNQDRNLLLSSQRTAVEETGTRRPSPSPAPHTRITRPFLEYLYSTVHPRMASPNQLVNGIILSCYYSCSHLFFLFLDCNKPLFGISKLFFRQVLQLPP